MLEKAFSIFFVVISIVLGIRYSFGFFDWCLTLFNIIVIYKYYMTHRFTNNFIVSMLVLYMVLSSNVIAAFQIQSSGFVLANTSTPFVDNDFMYLALFSNRTLACLSFVLVFFLEKKSSGEFKHLQNVGRRIPRQFPYIFISVAFVFSFLRIVFGITDMGDGNLPFHLNGVIDEYNRSFLPIVMAVFVYDALSRAKRGNLSFIALYFVWTLFETFARVSKGAMVTSLLPSLIILFVIGWFNTGRLVKYGIPVLLAFLIIYPTIETLRHAEEYSNFSNIQSAVRNRNNDIEEKSNPYIRLFISGTDYMKIHPTTERDPSLFYFGRVPILLGVRGSAGYMTYVIDGYSETGHQSSGTTGIVDPLLWGGYGFCYIVVALLALVSCLIDRRYNNNKKVLYYIIAIMFMKIIIMQRNVSFFMDGLARSALVSLLLQLFVVSIYYKRYFRCL